MIAVDDFDNIVDLIDFYNSLISDHCVFIVSFTTNLKWEIVHDDSAINKCNDRKIRKQWWWNDKNKDKNRNEDKDDDVNEKKIID